MNEGTARELISRAQFAQRVGVSRQSVDQAWARSTERPEPAYTGPRGVLLFHSDDLFAWWEKRQKTLWSANKGTRTSREDRVDHQINARFTSSERSRIDAIRSPGESMSSALRRTALAGLPLVEQEKDQD